MIVLIDIGNTRTKLIKKDEGGFSQQLSIDNKALTSSLLQEYFTSAIEVIYASVNKESTKKLVDMTAAQMAIPSQQVETQAQAFNIINCYAQPHRLGVDRWLALLGAALLYPKQTVLIIDSGTATTVDLLAASGEHLGGWILPGIDLMHHSLNANTANIGAQKQTLINITFGKNTDECVDNGCWAVLVGAIERAVAEVKNLGLSLDNTIITGGNSKFVQPLLPMHTCYEPNLVFHGLIRYSQS